MHQACNVETYDKQLAEYLTNELIVKGGSKQMKDLKEFDEMLPPMDWLADSNWKEKLMD